MANADTNTLGGLLKTVYPQTEIKRVGYRNRPFLAMIAKNTDFVGDPMAITARYAGQTGASSKFANAQANKKPNAYAQFLLRVKEDYAIGGITTKALRLARDKGAIVDGLKEEMDGLSYTAYLRLAHALYRNGGGAIGTILSGSGTQTITLTEPNDIIFFQKGMLLDGATTDGTSGSVITGGVGAVVSAVDKDSGKITATGVNWNSATAINGIADTNYLFPNGDFGSRIQGLDAWLPATVPVPGGGDSFKGVDRSVDTALAGNRTTSQGSIEESLLAGCERVFRDGGNVDTIFMHTSDYRKLVVALGSKVVYVKRNAMDANIGFKGVEIDHPGGTAEVFADPFCPRGIAYGLQLDTWKLWSAGDAVGLLNDDGNKMLRDYNSDSIEIRMGGYTELSCVAPWCNVRIVL